MTRLSHMERLRPFARRFAFGRRSSRRRRHPADDSRVGSDVTPKRIERTVRVGVFQSVADADRAVRRLLDAGFAKDEISVVCSVEAKERYFKEYEHDRPAGTTTPAAAAAGGVLGAMVAGVAAVAGFALTGGLPIIAIGPFILSHVGTGAVFGTFVGAMMSRGMERELANFYDQALRRGDLLVAAEIEPDGDRARLTEAERAFRESGARPLPLPAE